MTNFVPLVLILGTSFSVPALSPWTLVAHKLLLLHYYQQSLSLTLLFMFFS